MSRLDKGKATLRLALFGALLVPFGLLALAVTGVFGGPWASRTTAQATNGMSLDADPSTPGIQLTRVVPSGSFDILIVAHDINEPYQGYQWQLEWTDAVLDFVSNTENTGGTGLNVCAPATLNPASPGGKEWWGTGAGCVSFTGPTTFTGTLTTVTLQCAVTDGSQTEVRIVPVAEDAFGATYLAPGGAEIPTVFGGELTILCGQAPTPTPTASNTPTATFTATPTFSPSATPSPTLSPTPTATPTPFQPPNHPTHDSDVDGLSNDEEAALGSCPGLQPRYTAVPRCHVGGSLSNPLIDNPGDTDGDGLTDGVEVFTFETSVILPDSDGDGLQDGTEVGTGTSPGEVDTDGDSLADGVEFAILLTNPLSPNSDGDSCTDPQELGVNQAMGGRRSPLIPWDFFDVPVPALSSSASEGQRDRLVNMSDVLAVVAYIGTGVGRGPNATGVAYDDDVDGDGVPDGRNYDRTPSEVSGQPWRSGPPDGSVGIQDALVAIVQVGHACAPAPSAPLDDNDGDGLSDLLELSVGTCPGTSPRFQDLAQCHVGGDPGNPLIPNSSDTDADGLGDALEFFSLGSQPGLADTDGDGITDGDEYHIHRTHALRVDTDEDGVADGLEPTILTQPVNPDTDGDGCHDGTELGSNPTLGGSRTPTNPWDFFDASVPALTSVDPSGVRNRSVSIGDVLAVLFFAGTFESGGPNGNGVTYGSDVNGDGVADGLEYDRSPGSPSQPWRSGPPTGSVGIQDALIAVVQVGHHCE